jgi:hypothetical protein
VANAMLDKRLKGFVYGGNAVSYIKRGKADTGFEILKMTHKDTSESKAYALFPVSKYYLEINDIKKPLELIDTITAMMSLESDKAIAESLSGIRDELIAYNISVSEMIHEASNTTNQ